MESWWGGYRNGFPNGGPGVRKCYMPNCAFGGINVVYNEQVVWPARAADTVCPHPREEDNCIGFMGSHGSWCGRGRHIAWPCDLDLWPWRSRRLWLMRVFVLRLCTKLEVRRPSRSEDIGHLLREHYSAWWPNLWPFDLKIVSLVTRRASILQNLGFLCLSVLQLWRGTPQMDIRRTTDRQPRAIYNVPSSMGAGA